MTGRLAVAALYDGWGNPLLGSPSMSLAELFAARPCRRLLYDLDRPGDPADETAGLILALPPDGRPDEVAPRMLAECVTVLDAGNRVAIHADSWEAVEAAAAMILKIAGGWHA